MVISAETYNFIFGLFLLKFIKVLLLIPFFFLDSEKGSLRV